MSEAAEKPSSSESGHQLKTLTDVVRLVGETRSDVKVLDRKVDRLEQKVDRLEQKVDRLEQKVDSNQQENRERFDKIEETLTIIVNHLKK